MEILLSLIAIVISILTFAYEEVKFNKLEKNKQTPKLRIIAVQFMKNEHKRYSDGNEKRKSDVQNLYKLNKDAIEELEGRKQEVYFTDFNNERCLMLNFLTKNGNIIVEHNITRVTLINDCDMMLKSMAIESAEITYCSGANIILKGNSKEFVTFNKEAGNRFYIYLDEATNDFQNSICELNSEVYKNLSDKTDVIETRFFDYFLKYERIAFICRVSNSNNEIFRIKIALQRNENYLEPSTTIL